MDYITPLTREEVGAIAVALLSPNATGILRPDSEDVSSTVFVCEMDHLLFRSHVVECFVFYRFSDW